MDDDPQTLAHGDRTGVSVHAGFPNPAADLSGASPLSLDRLLIRHPSSTFLFRVRGDDWHEEGIFDGDIAVIDRTLEPKTHDLVVSWPDNSFTLVRYQPSVHHEPWGVVSYIIHQYRKGTI